MFKVAINFDEISDDVDISLLVMEECDVRYGELRMIGGRSFVFWSDDEVNAFEAKIAAAGVTVVAAASPLFKWYVNESDDEIEHDRFGFNPRLDKAEKRHTIRRTLEIAARLAIPRVRIFSGLGKADNPGNLFAQDELLMFALELADKYGVDLCVENEPVCRVCTQEHVVQLLDRQTSERLKLWFDIANSVEIGEEVDENFIQQVVTRLSYIHVKDFTIKNNQRHYVPLGMGQVNYEAILSVIGEVMPGADLVLSVETHATHNRAESSRQSILSLRQIISTLNLDH